MGLKQARCVGFVSRVSSLFRGSRVQLHALLWKLCWLASLSRDVTGKAPLSSEVVELVILWCYGFGTVLDFFVWFRCESPAGRLPGQPCARWSAPLRVHEHQRVARGKRRERARRSRVVLNSPFFWTSPKVAGPIRASVRGEAPPARLLSQGIFPAMRNNFYPCFKTLIRFTHYNITFVILLIHIILQPFIKV